MPDRDRAMVFGITGRTGRPTPASSTFDNGDNMEYLVLMVVPLALICVLTGIYWSVGIHDRRVESLTASQYTAMHQMRDVTFAKVMPFVGLGTLLAVVTSAALAFEPGWRRWLGIAAVVFMLVDTVLTFTRQLPLNREVQGWTEATIPEHWRAVRDGWVANHRMRTLFRTLACAALLTAVVMTLSDWPPPATTSARGNAENKPVRQRSCPLRNPRHRDWVIQAEVPAGLFKNRSA